MGISKSNEFWSGKLEHDEVTFVRYVGLIISVDRFIVVDDFHKVGDGYFSDGAVMSVAVTFIIDWDVFLNFPFRTEQIFRVYRI